MRPAEGRRGGRIGRRSLPFVVALVAAAAPLAGQPPCSPLPPPTGTTVEVFPAQAGSLRGIVAGAAGGTTILLHDGFYDLSGGDASSRLSFSTPGVSLRSLSGNRDAVILDAAYLTHELVSIQASNVTVADLTLRRAFDHPVHVSGDPTPITGARLHNLRIVDPGQQAVKVNPVGTGWVDDGVLECSSIELTSAGRTQIRDDCYTGGIDAHSARGWVVRRNRFEGFWCPLGLSEHAIHFWKTSRDTRVEENLIVDCARGIGFGLGSSGSGRFYPDDPYPGVGYLGHIDGEIVNNFVAAADAALFASEYGFDAGIALEQTRRPLVAHNSVASTQPPFSSIEWRFGNTLADIVNDLATGPLRPRDGAQAITAGNLEQVATNWFAGIATGDLHLTPAGAAAVDAGAAIPGGGPAGDFDLETRDASPDVGADEIVDPLFVDGFASGDTSAWSSVSP